VEELVVAKWKPNIKATEATLAVARKRNPVVLLPGKAFPKITAFKKAALKNLTLSNTNREERSKRTTRSQNHNIGPRYATGGNGAQFLEVKVSSKRCSARASESRERREAMSQL